MVYEFGNLRSTEVDRILREKPLVIVPTGQVEEHGPHLPLNTDCVIAERAAAECATRLGADRSVILMDLIPYGYSGKTMTRWPGTMQVRMDTVRDYLYDVCTSLVDMGVKKLAIFNNHGHHVALFELVVRMIADSRSVAPVVLVPLHLALGSGKLENVLKGGPGSSCHAGEIETSLMLYLAPKHVDLSKAKDNPLQDAGWPSKGAFWSTWERQPTKNGVYGTPTVARAETGKQIFEVIVESACDFLDRYHRGG